MRWWVSTVNGELIHFVWLRHIPIIYKRIQLVIVIEIFLCNLACGVDGIKFAVRILLLPEERLDFYSINVAFESTNKKLDFHFVWSTNNVLKRYVEYRYRVFKGGPKWPKRVVLKKYVFFLLKAIFLKWLTNKCLEMIDKLFPIFIWLREQYHKFSL